MFIFVRINGCCPKGSTVHVEVSQQNTTCMHIPLWCLNLAPKKNFQEKIQQTPGRYSRYPKIQAWKDFFKRRYLRKVRGMFLSGSVEIFLENCISGNIDKFRALRRLCSKHHPERSTPLNLRLPLEFWVGVKKNCPMVTILAGDPGIGKKKPWHLFGRAKSTGKLRK